MVIFLLTSTVFWLWFSVKILLHNLVKIASNFYFLVVCVYMCCDLITGQLDSNWCIGAVMEKKLPPLPFTFALSAFANHTKGAYRFGIGLIVG